MEDNHNVKIATSDVKSSVRKSWAKGPPTKPIFGYWNIKGRGQSIRYLLSYLKADVEEKSYESTEAPESLATWHGEKPTLGMDFPNIPYFVDTDGFCLSEHHAVMQYICNKYAPELLGRTAQEKGVATMTWCVINDLKAGIDFPAVYMGTKTQEEMATELKEKAAPLAAALKKSGGFILGE